MSFVSDEQGKKAGSWYEEFERNYMKRFQSYNMNTESKQVPATDNVPDFDQLKTPKQLTRGQQVMSVSFNPSQREDVAAIKQIFADAYDEIDKWVATKRPKSEEGVLKLLEFHHGDVLRLAKEAKAHLETAQMYAVKAVTR